MFSRYFLTFFIIVMFAFARHVSALEKEEEDDDVQNRNPLAVRAVLFLLKNGIKWAAEHCLKEAAEKCQHLAKKPKEAFNCGKDFIQANKGRCATGK